MTQFQPSKRYWLSLAGMLAISLPLCLPGESFAKPYKIRTSVSRSVSMTDPALQNGRYQEAERRYSAAVNANPNNTRARAGLSIAQAGLYKLDAAEKNAQRVLEKDSRNADAHAALGMVYRNRTASQDMTYRSQRDNLLNMSAQALEQAIRMDPDNAVAHNELGITYRFMEQYDRALAAFDKAHDLDPNFAEPILNQGIVKMTTGNIGGAKADFQQAIRQNSKNPMAHYRMGEAMGAEGNYHEALKHLNTALSLDRNNASIMNKMAEMYDKQGNSAAAIANYRKAIQSNPTYMPSYVGISNILDSRGDGELAMAELRSALNVNPKYNPARNQLGRLALTVDKPDQALQYYKEALQVNPQDPDALQGMSQALTVVAQKAANWGSSMGDESMMVDAERAVEDALKYNPNDMRLHLAHLRISQLAGKPKESEADLRAIISRPATNDVEQVIQGQAYAALGQYETSDQIFRTMIQKYNRDPDRLLAMADTLKANSDLLMAREAYQAALAAEPGNIKAQRGIQRIEKVEAEAGKDLRLGKALNNFIQRQASVDFYEDSLSKNPRQPLAWKTVAKIYERKKNYPKAINAYRQYIGLDTTLTANDKADYERKIQKLQTRMAEMQQAQAGQ